MIRRLIVGASLCALAGCGGGGGGAVSATPHTVGQGSLHIAFKVPATGAQAKPHAKNSLRALYSSPATMGAGVSILLPNATPPPAATPQFAFDLSSCSTTGTPPCTKNADGSRTYTFSSPQVPLGTYSAVISTWDAAPVNSMFSQAHELSEGIASVTITQTDTPINVTLNGIPASIQAVALPGQSHVLNPGDTANPAYMVIGDVPTQWAVTALDADGYIIAGDGAPVMSFSDSTNSVSLSQTAAQSNLYTMNVAAAPSPAPINVSVTATENGPLGQVQSTGTLSVYPQQEEWMTVQGSGIYGIMLDGRYGYQANSPSSATTATDIVLGTDNYGAIAEDANHNIWVVDATTNKIVEYAVSSASLPPTPTGTAISTTGTIAGIATDANGFLYVIQNTTGIPPLAHSHVTATSRKPAVAFDSLLVYNITGTPSLAFTVPLAGAMNAWGISVIPSTNAVPSTLRGQLIISSANGMLFFSNAKGGAPAQVGNTIPGQFGFVGVQSASVAPDSGLLWTLDYNYAVGVSTLAAGPSLTGITSIGSATDETGFIAAGIDNAAITSSGHIGGTDNSYIYSYNPFGPSVNNFAGWYFSSGANSYGLSIVP